MHMMREKLIRQLWAIGMLLWVVGAFLLLTGCASTPDSEDEGPVMPPMAEVPKQPVEISGAIFSQGTEMSLFEDIKARRVGDILTVMLVEQNSGTKSADTSLSQSTGMSVSAPVIGDNTFNEIGLNIGSEGAFAGESGSSQRNSLSGSISVTVLQVMPGGNLFVQGEKWIEINQGKEFIKLQGIIRPRDVRSNNTILSTQVADARISYSGTGATENSNVIGWVARLLFSPLKLF
jgi:flagellar L-ring protein precursor FlgH